MKSKTTHCCLSLSGALRWPARMLRPIAEGNGLTVAQLRDRFRAMLADGVQVVPVGPRCESFDDRKGCPGHVDEGEREAIARAWAE